jgi:hypothetical protein
MKRSLVTCGAAALALAGALMAGPASATIWEALLSGTVDYPSAFDNLGLFGPAGTYLGGENALARFDFDDTAGDVTSFTMNGHPAKAYRGGSYNGFSDPILNADLNIDGVWVDFTNPNEGDYTLVQHQQLQAQVNGPDFLSWNLDIQVFGAVPGRFRYDSIPVTGQGGFAQCVGTTCSRAPLVFTHLSIWRPGILPGPEPATWSMMLVGIFGLGGLLRAKSGAVPDRRSGRTSP